jgi:hypothetical protein
MDAENVHLAYSIDHCGRLSATSPFVPAARAFAKETINDRNPNIICSFELWQGALTVAGSPKTYPN